MSKIVSYEILMKRGIKSKIPASVAPMLCTLTKEVIQDEKYLYELKWDGYRIISYCGKGKGQNEFQEFSELYP